MRYKTAMDGFRVSDFFDDYSVCISGVIGSGTLILPNGTAFVALVSGEMSVNGTYILSGTAIYRLLPQSKIAYSECRAMIAVAKSFVPCMNYLHFPADFDETPHKYTSHCAGVVMRGEGVCRHSGRYDVLERGDIFVAAENTLLSFHTEDSAMDIAVLHQ